MIELAIKAAICAIFAAIALKYRILDGSGTFFAIIIGGVIIFTKGIGWFSLLLIFLLAGTIATKYRREIKRKRLHERAARKAGNVIANGLTPAALAALSLKYNLAIPFVASIAVAMADTFASELGVLSDNAYLITNLKKVEPGTNGAISMLGEGVALLGSFIISFSAYFLIGIDLWEVILCAFLGFLGCHIDSILGATFQGGYKGVVNGEDTILTNSDVNLISISLTALIAYLAAEAMA